MSGDPLLLAGLAAAAFATSIVSAMLGLAGGILLLAVMLLFLPPLVAIPVHGGIQLVSNAARTWIQRRQVRRDLVLCYALLLLPAGALALPLAARLPAPALTAGIGVFVLVATWLPRGALAASGAGGAAPRGRFVALGAAAGALNVTVGATGPLIAPFFQGLGLSRQAIVGTMAACQTLGHAAKLGVFGGFGFSFGPWLPLFALGSVCTIAGTWLGSRLLERLDERRFTLLYRLALSAIAVRLVASGLLG